MARSSLLFRGSVIPYPGVLLWRAAVNYVTDGDTVWVERDTGCRAVDMVEIRLTGPAWHGFDAPETKTAEGKAARDYVRTLLPAGTVVVIMTKPDPEKYGRWLSPILVHAGQSASPGFSHAASRVQSMLVGDRDVSLFDLASHLVDLGMGRWREYSALWQPGDDAPAAE